MDTTLDREQAPSQMLRSSQDPESTRPSEPYANQLHSGANMESVAIIGMACRTAGGVDNPEKLWELLHQRRNASGEIPAQRWEPWRCRDSRNAKILDNITRKGYFLDNLEAFDAAFFGISPREAELMDPHQRLGLELAWEAIEHAGIDVKKLQKSDTAVFMGVDSDDYSRMLLEDLPTIEAWSGIGTASHGIPNRISYHLDLQGPSVAVDSACASSLIAIHLARQAISTGESTVAICGGVNVICAPGLTHMLQKAGALTEEGVCRSFDDAACGYARGEGGAVVVLKRLSAAIADDDNILAVLRGSASAQDGKTNGIMAPNAQAQELVARKALLRAGDIDPHTIDYVEAHATSTLLGDPVEIDAIARVYGAGRSPISPCYVGSIKPNVGHLEAAAGAIGFVKTVLSVRKGILIPQTLLRKLNTKIDWMSSGLEVIQDEKAWPDRNVRRAAVCSYGYGGSVCHAILEQAPPTAKQYEDPESKLAVILTLSAVREKRLPAYAASLAKWLSSDGASIDLNVIARTLFQRRTAHDFRSSFVVASHEEAIQTLKGFAKDRPDGRVTSNRIIDGAAQSGAVWVFSGHGAQWPEMGRELLCKPVFRHALSMLDEVIQEEAGFSVIRALEQCEPASSHKVQVLTYAVQIGLAALLESQGVAPNAIVGHSVGEIAAAVAAGCLSAREGAIIVSRRSRLYEQVQGKGAMALVGLSFETVAEQLKHKRDIVAAIKSSPTTSVVSGTAEAVESYIGHLAGKNINSWKIATDIGFHSPMIEHLGSALRDSLRGDIDPKPAALPLYSTSAMDAKTTSTRDVEYWIRNMVAPVNFVGAVEAAANDGFRIFVEISSHPIVSHSMYEILASMKIHRFATFGIMKRGVSATLSVLKAVSHLHTLGVPIDSSLLLGEGAWSNELPTAAWVHKPFWKATSLDVKPVPQRHGTKDHTLLGTSVEIADCETRIWTTMLDNTSKPYPMTHCVSGREIVPAAVYCMTLEKATGANRFDCVRFLAPTLITEDKREFQVVVKGDEVQMSSRAQTPSNTGKKPATPSWIKHTVAKCASVDLTRHQQVYSVATLKEKVPAKLSSDFAWNYLRQVGVASSAFPWTVLEHFGNKKMMLAKVDVSIDGEGPSAHVQSWAPLLDAATSVGSSVLFETTGSRVVSGIDQMMFLSNPEALKIVWLYIKNSSQDKSLKVDVQIFGEDGRVLVKLRGISFSNIAEVRNQNTDLNSLVHRLAWVPPKFSETPLPVSNVILVSTDSHALDVHAGAVRAIAERVLSVPSSIHLQSHDVMDVLQTRGAVVIYLPGSIEKTEDVAVSAHTFTCECASILSTLSSASGTPRLFVITQNAHSGRSPTCLAQYPLYGFARIAASEFPHLWGGLIDSEGPDLPLLPLRFVREQPVVRMQDGLPRVPRLRPFAKEQRYDSVRRHLLPQPHGTYVITGGFGSLGLEILEFLVVKGARRILVVSRRSLPSRTEWPFASGSLAAAIRRVRKMESAGATIHSVALDIGSSSACADLSAALDRYALPPVLGVVHAAGVAGYEYIKDATPDSYAAVLKPKIQGALTLHELFAPGALDFFVLFSSIGQIIGTPGQSAYATANAFLDGLAMHRRAQGCNTIAIQWTAWRGLGLASDTALVDLELHSKGVTDITIEQGLQAWVQLSQIDTAHAVVANVRDLGADEPLPCELIAEVVQRNAGSRATDPRTTTSGDRPSRRFDIESTIDSVRRCLSDVLGLSVDDIDDSTSMADLGLDSILTTALHQKLEKKIGIPLPRTLTWSFLTVGKLGGWICSESERRSEEG